MNDPGQVKVLQEALNVWAGRNGAAPIPADGAFGRSTFSLVVRLQRAAAIEPAHGIVDAATWAALEREVGPIALPAALPRRATGARAIVAIDLDAPAAPPRAPARSTSGAVRTVPLSAIEGAGPAPAAPPAPAPRPVEVFAARPRVFTSEETGRLETLWASAVPGRTSVTLARSNGGRAVAVHIPAELEPSRPARVVTFFHAPGWDIGAKARDGGILDRVKTLCDRDPQTVFVLPLGPQAPATDWMRPPESFRGLHEEALGEAARLIGGPLTVAGRTVDAHAGGGAALKNAVESNELAADKVNLLDAALEDWGQTVTRWAVERRVAPRPRVESWYTNYSTLPRNNDEMKQLGATVNPVRDRQADLPKYHMGKP